MEDLLGRISFYSAIKLPLHLAGDFNIGLWCGERKIVLDQSQEFSPLIGPQGLIIFCNERIPSGSQWNINIKVKLGKEKFQVNFQTELMAEYPKSKKLYRYMFNAIKKDRQKIKDFYNLFLGKVPAGNLQKWVTQDKMAYDEQSRSSWQFFQLQDLAINFLQDADEDKVMFLLKRWCRTLKVKEARLYLVNPMTNQLFPHISTGKDRPLSMGLCEGVVGHTFNTGKIGQIHFHSGSSNYGPYLMSGSYSDHSQLCFPVMNRGNVIIGVLQFFSKKLDMDFTDKHIHLGRFMASMLSDFYRDYYPVSPHSMVHYLNSRRFDNTKYVGNSSFSYKTRFALEKLKLSPLPLLISGEYGTGKNYIATIHHQDGPFSNNEFITYDFASAKDDLQELCLYTLKKRQPGTLFLRNVHLATPRHQETILKYSGQLSWKIISSTQHSIEDMIQNDKFHPDVYRYLNSTYIHLSPLRMRLEDILPLASYLLRKICHQNKVRPKSLSVALREALVNYYWPGNSVELEQIVRESFELSPEGSIVKHQEFVEKIRAKPGSQQFYNLMAHIDSALSIDQQIEMEGREFNDQKELKKAS